MTMTGAWGWLGLGILAAVPVLIFLLYFLKLRRTRLEVPSTFLWRRSVEDMQVNSLWQRLRSSLLLWLQLAIALLLLLSMLPLGCQSQQRVGQRHIFLLDTSASMSATDVETNRFEAAKKMIEAQLDGLRDIDLAMLMTSDDQAQIRQAYTSDRGLLRRKLSEVTQRPRLTNMEDAIIAATSLANPTHVRDASDSLTPDQVAAELQKDRAVLHMYSDGGFPPVRNAALGELNVEFVPVGTNNPINLGITTFNAQWNEKKRGYVDLYARVENFSPAQLKTDIELVRNGEVIDVIRRDKIDPKEVLTLDFQDSLVSAQNQVTEYELRIVAVDDFAADNVAYCVVNPGRKPQVMLITAGNSGLQAALSTTLISEGLALEVQQPEFVESEAYRAMTEQPLYDLVVFDRVAPSTLPMSNTMFWGAVPSSDWQLSPLEPPIFVLYSNSTHPVTLNLNLDTLAFLQAESVKGPPASVNLLTANEGSLMVIAPRVGFQDLVIGFSLLDEIDNQIVPVTDWPGKISFPVFIYNSLEFLGRLGQKEIASSIRPGQAIRFRLESAETQVKVISPSGAEQQLNKLGDGGFLFTGADELGLYRVQGDQEKHLRSFAVSLASRMESDIAIKNEMVVGYTQVLSSSESVIRGENRMWRYLLFAALAVIFVEWVVYNRRILL